MNAPASGAPPAESYSLIRPERRIVRRPVVAATDLGGLHPVLARIYAGRGVRTKAEIDYSLARLLPCDGLHGIAKAVALLVQAIEEGARILVVADFDADGATACAVAVRGLEALGAADVRFLVPNRFEFGYGLTPEIVAVAARQRPDLLITVDVVMVLMALDHVRDHFTDAHFRPTDLSRTTAALFLTRWLTHFCTPAFFLLAGLGASLSLSRGKTRSTLGLYLVTRGLWLMVLEVTVVSFAWTFNFTPMMYELGVIWALGCSMLMLAGLVYLPRALIAAFAVLLIGGHNLFDDLRADDLKSWGPLWAILHTGEDIALTSSLTIDPFYPLVPWVGVRALGYALGPMLEKGALRSRRLLLGSGMMLTAAFVLLRVANAYGDPAPWSAQLSALVTVLQHFSVE